MIRYRAFFFLLFLTNILITSTEDAPQIAEDKISNPKPPDKLILEKSQPYSQGNNLLDKITNWFKTPVGSSAEEKKSSNDLTASATGYVGSKYLPPSSNHYRGQARSCYDCNSEPWIPIIGRSLHFPPPPSSHSNNLDYSNHDPYHPPLDQYGAPKATYGLPHAGEVVDFMLPPPYTTRNGFSSFENYGPPKPTYSVPNTYGPPKIFRPPSPTNNYGISSTYGLPNKPPAANYGVPLTDISPPPLYNSPLPPRNNYGAPPTPIRNYRRKPVPTTYLRPVSQDFQPPLSGGGIHTLPLENNLPPAIPSDSYGRPIPSNSYSVPQKGFVEPITLGSGDSEEYGKQVAYNSPNHFASFDAQQSAEIKQSLFEKGLTDVQVVPSVRVADFTASIEHPINIIQSPILDLNIKGQEAINEYIGGAYPSGQPASYEDLSVESKNKLSENPIVVEDTYTSASNINTTYSSEDNNSTALKRHNDKYLSSAELFGDDKLKEADLTNHLIQKLIVKHKIIQNPQTQIVGIQKTIINPQKVQQSNFNLVQPSIELSSYDPPGIHHLSPPSYQSSLPTVMVPPRPPPSTWLTPVNRSFISQSPKNSKKLKIIVPYVKSQENNNLQWNNKATAIYNREYTTLAPVFIPPPMGTETTTSLWTQLAEDMKIVESHKEPAQGFINKLSVTTEVYNIKDFIVNQQQASHSNNLPYDVISLQKNIDDWTHQAYSNKQVFGTKLTTKMAHIKNIPSEYFTSTTPSYDHVAAGSEKKEFISNEIDDTDGDATTQATVQFIVRQPKPSWDESKVILSNSTHEKVYVVTPQSYIRFQTSTPATVYSMAPKIQNGKVNNASTMTRISVRVEASPDENGKELKPLKVVYSEWPHLINNLETTTTIRTTSRHPLFGLMDLAPYTAQPNATVETISGHSKVTSIVTSSINKYGSTTPMPSTNVNQTVKITAE